MATTNTTKTTEKKTTAKTTAAKSTTTKKTTTASAAKATTTKKATTSTTTKKATTAKTTTPAKSTTEKKTVEAKVAINNKLSIASDIAKLDKNVEAGKLTFEEYDQELLKIKENAKEQVVKILEEQRGVYVLSFDDDGKLLEFKVNWDTNKLLYSRGNTKAGKDNYKLVWNTVKEHLDKVAKENKAKAKEEKEKIISAEKARLESMTPEEIANEKQAAKEKQIADNEKAKQKEAKAKADEAAEAKKENERRKLLNSKVIFQEDSEFALKLKNVKKHYGFKNVLKGVTFDIKKGERLALIGKNGAGKSTLINVIAQQAKLSEGEIRYGYASNRVESLERMGIQFQALNYPEGFIVKDVIKFFNASVDKSIRMSNKELSDMISMFGIDKYLNQAIDRLSGGQQQRINILLALIKKPHLLILDEISTGLDVESAEVIKGYIDQFLQKYPETALLLISHSDEEIRAMSERVVVLEAGKISENFPSKELTLEKFLEITSREPKLSKKEIKKIEAESERHLRQLRRRYVERRESKLTQTINEWKTSFDEKFDAIDNSLIDAKNSVEIRGVSKTYGKTVGAVRNVSLDIEQGSRIAITGPNGSGKSTIVEIIAQVKTADSESSRYTNLKNLAKADYEREIKKLDEDLNVEIRQQRNKYRLQRELAYNEARELESNKNALAKEMKEKATEKAAKANATKKALEDAKKTLAMFKEEITEKATKMIDAADAAAEKARAEVDALREKLEIQKLEDIETTKQAYLNRLDEIKEQEARWKEDDSFRLVPSYIEDGKEVSEKEENDGKPMFAYSFAETGTQVRDNVGVQFQYASFPVEMSVLDVILFFARTNKFFMTKEEIIEAVKVFKLEKLLKSKAYSLSGGERQRLNVLLAIMKSPKLLILDEISTGLDVDSVMKIDAFIKDYLDKTNATLILISHNYHEVDSLTDKIVVMKYGKLTEIVNTKGWTTAQTKEKMRDIYKGGAV